VNDFLFVIIELFSLALAVEALQGKTCHNSLLSGYDTMIITCAQKLTYSQLNLPHGTKQKRIMKRVGEGRSLEAKISGEGVVAGEYFLVSTKLDTFCFMTVQTAPCYGPSF